MVKKPMKKKQSKKEEKQEEEGGMSLDDAFGGDDDVEYAPSKPKKEKKRKMDDEELEDEIEEAEEISNGSFDRGDVDVKQSKPVSKVKKGDKIKIDGREYEVDAHYVLIDHGTTKEMAIEIFDKDSDKDYQLRYFDDQVESTIELYELQEILYVKRPFKKVEW